MGSFSNFLSESSVSSVSHISPTLCKPAVYKLSVSSQQGSLQKPAVFNISVNKLQSSLTKPAATNLLISRQQGSLQKPAGFNLSVNKPQSSRHSSVRDTSPTHGHNKPMSAVITPHVVNTAYTSTHPLSVYTPHDESRSEMQRVEALSQPFSVQAHLGLPHGQRRRGL